MAYDLQTLDAGVWLLCSGASGLEKNILASVKLIVVEADVSAVFYGANEKEHRFEARRKLIV
ncbi:MAG: hypothetical protein WA581_04025 [Candidatus Acidiferrales bacterium]